MVLICEAVGAAHRKGVVHRDLKPSNIIVTAENQARVLDFGIAKATCDTASSDKVSFTGTILGTLNYMSPEQAAGNIAAIDTSTDVYALCVILFELLTGEFPYSMDGSLGQNLLTIQQQPPIELTSINEKLDQRLAAILAKGLSKEQGLRYQDASALGDDLQRFLADEEIEARTLCGSVSKTRWRRGVPLTLLLTSALLATAAIGWWVQPWRGDAPPIAAPLKPLDDGQKYSRAELDTQIDAIRDMIRFQYPPAEILRQFFTRFQDLAEEDFEAELSDERKADDFIAGTGAVQGSSILVGTFRFTAGSVLGEVTNLRATDFDPTPGNDSIVSFDTLTGLDSLLGADARATITVSTVPEPSSFLLLFSAMVVACQRRSRYLQRS